MVLQDIQSILNSDVALSGRVRFQVKEKGLNERRRYEKLLEYQGPDEETVNLLERNHERWLADPAQFWRRPAAPDLSTMDPRAQIIGCFLHTRSDDA